VRSGAIESDKRTDGSNAKVHSLRGWTATDTLEYKSKLTQRLADDAACDASIIVSLDTRCCQIEQALLEIGKECHQVESKEEVDRTENRDKLRELISQRKSARVRRDKISERTTSKLIQKEMKAMLQARKRTKIESILEQFRGLKYITGIKKNGKQMIVGSVLDSCGQERTDRQEIVDVFADFYADLYACRTADTSFCLPELEEEVVAISATEVKDQLKSMSNKKSPDSNGVVAELLKQGSDKLIENIATLFSDILNPAAVVPEYWKQTRLKVLFKKGDAKSVDNYRPICIVPILYKVFTQVVLSRV